MTITVELTIQQILQAIRQLSLEDRLVLLQTLIREDKDEVNRRFDIALAAVHEANRGLDEDEVMTQLNQIVHEVRANRYAAYGV